MRTVISGDREIDRCLSCGASWFDAGEILELTEGRFPAFGGEAPGSPAPDGPGGGPSSEGDGPSTEKPGALRARMRREAARMGCPRCGKPMTVVDYQAMGVPLFACAGCRGLLVTAAAEASLVAKFRLLRENKALYDTMGAAIAEQVKRRVPLGDRLEAVPSTRLPLGRPWLPLVVPLADDAPGCGSFPFATALLLAIPALLYVFPTIAGYRPALPGGLPGLPSGTGFAAVPPHLLLVYAFFPGGLLPLVVGSFFLFVLGDNVEGRMGVFPFLGLFVGAGAVAGFVHVLWGSPPAAVALGPAGAVAGVLGAYLVFFPNATIRMYGMGRVLSVPAYIFACAWLTGAFLFGPGQTLTGRLLDPSPMSLPGSIAGFLAGVAAAFAFRQAER